GAAARPPAGTWRNAGRTWGPRDGPHTPNPSERPGETRGAPLSRSWRSPARTWGPRDGPHTPNPSERPGETRSAPLSRSTSQGAGDRGARARGEIERGRARVHRRAHGDRRMIGDRDPTAARPASARRPRLVSARSRHRQPRHSERGGEPERAEMEAAERAVHAAPP